MPLGDGAAPPRGNSDHVVGTGHKGKMRAVTDRLTTSTGEQVTVPLYEYYDKKKSPPSSEKPTVQLEAPDMAELEEDLQPHGKPTKIVLNDQVEDELMWRLFYEGGFAEVEVALSSVLMGAYWRIPRSPKEILIFPRENWERIQQLFLEVLNPDEDGPLNPSLHAEPLIASLFDAAPIALTPKDLE